MPRLNYQIIFHIMGLLLLCNGGFMLLVALVSWFYNDGTIVAVSSASLITLLVGIFLMFFTRDHSKDLKKREGYIVVSCGWVFMALSGTLPYILSDSIPSLNDAFFEAMSGYTTTGSSILSDVESIPKSLLFWRSLTNWIGGMGMIVLAIAILPLLGVGGMQLFSAEAPGPTGEKMKPRITDIAKRLWLIYVGFTLCQTILLKFSGMGWFDAVCTSFSTLSTGGFSTKNASIAYWNDNPWIQYIIVFFMFMGGVNFVLSYYGFKGRFKKIFSDEEFKFYALIILVLTTITATVIYLQADFGLSSINHPMVLGRAESSFRHAIFQVVSVVTTTGFITADFSLWTPFLTVLFFGMFFLGGSAGSTAGGIKVMRHIIMIKNGMIEFKRALHPNAVLPVRFNKRAISKEIVFNILGFFILYMLSFIVGTLVLAFMGIDFVTSLGAAASSLGNVGPALGELGPVNNYGILPAAAKWWCAFLMLIGRLELFTVLILFTPYFWRSR